ncbi:hypothetical protein KAZ92_02370 [Candidatus Gracilibacteria bacterium]|nr:hypothetical protein [Candidatus Gracilibacteria bacterium]
MGKHENQFFDQKFPESQRLPRIFEYKFVPNGLSSAGFPQIRLMDSKSGQVGNTLTDNAREDSGYRFHDVIHAAFAVFLGWSPVVRAFFHRKRKNNPVIDEVEDGGLAILIEEAIVRLCYEEAEHHHFFEHTTHVPRRLLRYIKQLTRRLEVHERGKKEWKQAIVSGFEVWRHVRRHNGGTIRGNLEKRTLEFVPLP